MSSMAVPGCQPAPPPAAPAPQALRGKAESIRATELEKTLNKLGDGLTNKQKKVGRGVWAACRAREHANGRRQGCDAPRQPSFRPTRFFSFE